MNPYHTFQGRAASWELQTKLRFGRKFVPCCCFFSLTAGCHHFCVQLLCGLSNKQRSPRNSCINFFLSVWKTGYQPLNASPAGRGERWHFIQPHLPHMVLPGHFWTCANSIKKCRILQDFLDFSCPLSAGKQHVTDTWQICFQNPPMVIEGGTHLPNRNVFSTFSPVMIQAPHPLCCAAKLQRARFPFPVG